MLRLTIRLNADVTKRWSGLRNGSPKADARHPRGYLASAASPGPAAPFPAA